MYPDAPSAPADPAELTQLLDDHHLVLIGDDPAEREGVARGLKRHLETVPDSQAGHLRSGADTTLEAFCTHLEVWAPEAQPPARTPVGIGQFVRDQLSEVKHEYLIWEDAEELLEADVDLFSRVVNALLIVAAEREFVSPELLVLQRVVFVGGHKLGAYAEEGAGQFRVWHPKAEFKPSPELQASLDRPRVLTYRLNG